MKYFTLITIFLSVLAGCKKEDNTLPKLSFTTEDRKWFNYQIGQTIKLKNVDGDSIVYTVTSVLNDFKPEYRDPFTNPVEIGTTEFYKVDLISQDDSIFIYFYKQFLYVPHPEKIKLTIRWNSIKGQIVSLEAIDTAAFTTKVVNGITYNSVTPTTSSSQYSYPWTKWETANYNQQFGFIEIIDTSAVSWFREL